MKAKQPNHRLVNFSQLADILSLDGNTLRKLIRANPGFPVEKRGRNGVAYGFDLKAVWAWWQGNMPTGTRDDAEMSPTQAKAVWEARRIELAVREKCGELVPVDVFNAYNAEIWTLLRQQAMKIPIILVRQYGASREVGRACDDLLRAAFNAMSDQLLDPAGSAAVKRSATAWVVDEEVRAKLLAEAARLEAQPADDGAA